MMSTRATHPTGVKLEPSLKTRLKKLGKAKHRTTHWLMKEAIAQYIEREEEAEQLKKDTLLRWQEAEQNKIVSHHKVADWLDTWGRAHEKERPECEK
jgi:predicted transcriptional regulator